MYHCDWRALLPVVDAAGGCDLLCVDAPYGERTHSGHDGVLNRGQYKGGRAPGSLRDSAERRSLDYAPWTDDDVVAFCEAWCPRTRGWFIAITDHSLAPVWQREMARHHPPGQAESGCGDARWEARYTFAPLPFVAPGSRVRLVGDGPALWAVWVVVSRPRYEPYSKWGSLPGAYVLPSGYGGALPVVGGKPIWLLSELVKDYSRPGDLCVDPTCGAGTLAVAALREGRRAIVGDALKEHADLAAQWIKHPHRPAPTGKAPKEKPGQIAIPFARMGES